MSHYATVIVRNNKPKAVKNLGWLLRHWKEVEWLGFNYQPNSREMIDGELVAQLKGGTVYLSSYSSLSVCWNWLNRPIFKGLQFRLVMLDQHENNRRDFTIGDAQWLEINKLEHSAFESFVNGGAK